MSRPFVNLRSSFRASLLGLTVTLGAVLPIWPATAQDREFDTTIARPVVQPLPSRGSFELNAALTRLAANPRDVNALIEAGNAAMTLGDSEAAMGFLGRADQLSPGNPRVKATLASAMVRNENPYDAIPLFDAAERAGASDAMLAGDRGLAYDLVGDNPSAQRFYRQAMAAAPSGEGRDEIARRLALSLAIYGDRKGFEAALQPQLQSSGTAAWRTRAFGLAILGEQAEAVKIAYGTMPRAGADAMAPYLRYMIKLTPAQQVAAANFGHFPRAAQVGRDDPRAAVFASAVTRRPRTADAGLIPEGKPLGGRAATARTDNSKAARKRKRDTQVAAAGPIPAPRITAAPASASASVPAARAPNPAVRIAAATLPPAVTRPISTPPPSSQPNPTLASALTPNPVAATIAPQPAANNAQRIALAMPSPTPTPGPAALPAIVAKAHPAPGPLPAARAFDTSILGEQVAVATPLPSVAVEASARTSVSPSPPPASSALTLPSLQAPFASPPAAPQTAAPAPAARIRLADAFSDFRPPEDEARSAVAAVDIGTIQRARSRDSDARSLDAQNLDAKNLDGRGPVPGAPSGTRRSASVEVPVSAKAAKSAGAAKVKPNAPTHPSRIWIQLAAGRDKAALGFDWRKQTRASADLFKARKAWTTPWGQTNRLLLGPFESQAAAGTFLKELKKKDADAFVWSSPAGQAVDPLSAK